MPRGPSYRASLRLYLGQQNERFAGKSMFTRVASRINRAPMRCSPSTCELYRKQLSTILTAATSRPMGAAAARDGAQRTKYFNIPMSDFDPIARITNWESDKANPTLDNSIAFKKGMSYAQTLDLGARSRIHLDCRYCRQRGLLVGRILLSVLLLERLGSVRLLLMLVGGNRRCTTADCLPPNLKSVRIHKMDTWIVLLRIFVVAVAAAAVTSCGGWKAADDESKLELLSHQEVIYPWPEGFFMKPGGTRMYSCRIKPNSYFCY